MRERLYDKFLRLRDWFQVYAYYFREKHTRPWNIWCRHRRQFLASSDWMLADSRFPILQRIWFRHLFWIGYFAGGFLRLYLSDFRRTGTQAYCKLADAVLGGNRAERFLEARKQKLAELKARNRLRAETRRQQDDLIFQLRLRQEAVHNPHFVATPHTHQDR
jgi:hypothetical protein